MDFCSTNLFHQNQKIMFTVEEIKAAHKKVRSGADFPQYIREIKLMGVKSYETWVTDSHTEFQGSENYQVISLPLYENLEIALQPNTELFKTHLKAHQQGETDYLTFTKLCAEMGIEKWRVSLQAMTCTYYDRSGNEVLIEEIPA